MADTQRHGRGLVGLAGSDEIVYLNELCHLTGTALSLRLPSSKQGLITSEAILGREGIMEGTDYRGVPVLASGGTIAGTRWIIVAKEDQAEIYAPLHERAALAVAFGSPMSSWPP